MKDFLFAIVNFVTFFVVSSLTAAKKWMNKIAIYRFYRRIDGVGFFYIRNFRQLAEVLVNGGFMSAEDARDWLCINGINFAVGFTFSINDINFIYIPKEVLYSHFGWSILMHEICHIKNRHVEKILHGDYKGMESEIICGQVVVYNFEAQADAYALKKSGRIFYENEESIKLFKELYKKCSLNIIDELEALYDIDLTACKDAYKDDVVIEAIVASMRYQFVMRKKLLPKYL